MESYQPVWADDCILKHLKVATVEDPMLQSMLTFYKKDSHQIPGDMRRRLQAYTFNDGILHFQDLIYVPDDNELRRQILQSRHDAQAAGHQGRAKTLEVVTRSFY